MSKKPQEIKIVFDEIVKCKECKHFRDTRNDELERTPNSDGWCKRISRWGDVKCVRVNDFCSYGEREGE